ncbi:MAG TPA: 4,5-dihydroxyphthalate decarboxylase [Xanthobacteraceae bacterium]|jgi:4,5-dihydroxyphthalate decarboxylase
MSELRLSLALSDYVHTRDIADGRIRPVGIDLIVNTLSFEEAAFRFGANLEFDISEYSLANYCARVAAPEPAPLLALPVFTSRVFRHSAIYVRDAAGIRDARDLAGRRVGIPQWSQTATVYVRGWLVHQAGIALESIDWIQAGVDQPGRHDPIRSRLPPGIRLEARPKQTLSEMLLSGEIDAMITARPPRCFREGADGVSRLFPNYREEEERYFAATGIFPIMHVIAVKRQVYENHPWVARNLVDAFEAAKRASLARMRNIQTSHLPTAWGAEEIERVQRLLFGDGEPWPYGLEPNRRTLEPFLAYCHEQGITERRLRPEELFPKEAAFEVRI